jgi:hypothetical protein
MWLTLRTRIFCTDEVLKKAEFLLYRHLKCLMQTKVSFRKKCSFNKDRPCGLVVRVPDYRSRGPGSIPGTTRFSKK